MIFGAPLAVYLIVSAPVVATLIALYAMLPKDGE